MGRPTMHRLLQEMRIKRNFVLKLAAAIMQHSFAFSAFISKPMNTVSVVGNKTKIECSRNPHPSHPVNWEFSPAGSKDFSLIYIGKRITESLSSRYKIDTDNGTRYNIVIDSVDMSHAGTYRCTPIAEEQISASAELLVIGSSPECSSNASSTDQSIMENGYIWMRCIIVYAGNMIPIFSWTKTKTYDVFASETSTTDNHKMPMTTTSSMVRHLHSDDNGVTFKCNIKFRLPSNSTGNAPEYEYAWNYTVRVLYGPRCISIVREGDRLECSADGNPTPTYRWTHVGTNTFKDGAIFNLDGIYDRESTFQCTATNIFANETKNITLQGPDTSRIAIVAAAVGGWSLLLFLIIVNVSYFVRGKILKVRGFGRGDSQVRAPSIQVSPPARTHHVTTEELNSPRTPNTENEDSQIQSTNAGYSALTNRPVKVQEPHSYCQLKLDDQPSAIYINQSSTERKQQKNNDPVYCEIIELHV